MTGEGTDATGDPDDGDSWWNDLYEADERPPWDVGRPQPAIRDLLEAGAIEGRVLDAGCGTGTHALALVERGHDVTGFDVSPRAIELARAKLETQSADRDETRGDPGVALRVADALSLPADLGPFGTVVDSGLCHAFDADDRAVYADELAAVTRPGARAFVLAFGPGAPDHWGPNPLSRADVEAAFADGWRVRETREATFETRIEPIPGLLATLERV